MGRVVLLTALAAVGALATACVPDSSGEQVTAGHEELTCAACHAGNLSDRGLASVPETTCRSSECHARGGPIEIRLSTTVFGHRAHGSDSEIVVGCAGCHSHAEGVDPLTAGVDACALCHAEEMASAEGRQCSLCHGLPDHTGWTSQGVAVPHDALPRLGGSCTRCHYDVVRPPTDVSAERCRACHDEGSAVLASGIAEDLHPSHPGIGCITCHASDAHRVQAISSSVSLQCDDCHGFVHEVDLFQDPLESAACIGCHRDTHAEEQRLVLGLIDEEAERATPSEKFWNGLTCRSCHVSDPERASSGDATLGGEVSCVGCHRPEYATVLSWWIEGSTARQRHVGDYLDAARRALAGSGAPDTVRVMLNDASRLLQAIVDGGGHHNLLLSHRSYQKAVRLAEEAYSLAGRAAPPPPSLGRTPQMGQCSYCHYRDDEPWSYREMEGPFHEKVVGGR